MQERLPALQITLPAAGERLDPASLFDPPRARLWLEIGCGGGEHLAAQAGRHPEVGMLGCEPYLAGVARLLSLVEAGGLDNVRLLVDDARLLLAALPDACLERVFVLFPDPWPKTRHHKRRLIAPATAAALARLLQPGGELRLATDDMSYARAMLLALLPRAELRWQAARPGDWRKRPDDWPPTRYEEKALAAGRAAVYLRFARLAGPPGEVKRA